jgi:hypothetical protein
VPRFTVNLESLPAPDNFHYPNHTDSINRYIHIQKRCARPTALSFITLPIMTVG